MFEWIGAVVGAGLLGSAHCAGMCGGIVNIATASPAGSGLWRAHAAYQLSRLAGYVALGGVAGALGSSVNLAGSLMGWKHTATVVAGAAMIAWGLAGVWPRSFVKLTPFFSRKGSTGLVARLTARIAHFPRIGRAAAFGALTSLLPCGWLYTFVVAAAGTASAARGASIMLAFWLGSAPVLIGLGTFGRALYRALGHRTPLFSSLVLLALGFANLWAHYNVPARAIESLTATSVLNAEEGAVPPCHAHLK